MAQGLDSFAHLLELATADLVRLDPRSHWPPSHRSPDSSTPSCRINSALDSTSAKQPLCRRAGASLRPPRSPIPAEFGRLKLTVSPVRLVIVSPVSSPPPH